MNYPVYSADGHIDLPCMPAEIFVENAPAKLRDRMPKVVERDDGKRHWVNAAGKSMGLYGGMGSAGRPPTLSFNDSGLARLSTR